MTPSNSLLDDAINYSQRGISCIPITRNKKPPIKWKEYQTRRPNHQELRDFFGVGVTGVAVISGAVSGGLAIRDFDKLDSYESFAEKNPALAKTLPTVRTTRGFHLYCRSNLEHIVDVENGEYRGAGYTLAPCSLHPDGTRYEWIIPLPPGELPEVDARMFLGVEKYTEKRNAIGSASLSISAISVYSPSEVVQRTQPTKPGERNACILKLARGLKFNCGLNTTKSNELIPIVKTWHEQAYPVIRTKDFEVTWLDFRHAFEEARYPLDMDILDAAAARVDPDELPGVANNYFGQTTRRLIGFCWLLASMHPKRNFFLSCHVAAKRLNAAPMTIWKILRTLRADNVIQCLEKGNEYRASRYRWIAPPTTEDQPESICL